MTGVFSTQNQGAEARQTVTVALSGDASDELFGDYNRYFWGSRIWRRLDWMPHPVRRRLGRAVAALPVNSGDRLGPPAGDSVTRPGDKARRLVARLRDIGAMENLYRSLGSGWQSKQMQPGLGKVIQTLLDGPLPEVLAGNVSATFCAR